MKTDVSSIEQRRALRQALSGGGQWGLPKSPGEEGYLGGAVPMHAGGLVEKTGDYRLQSGEVVIPAPRSGDDDWSVLTIHRVGDGFIAMFEFDDEPPEVIISTNRRRSNF